MGTEIRRTIIRPDGVHTFSFEEDGTLLEFVEDALGVTSASQGCRDGSCGTCRVLLDNNPVNACLVRWRDLADGARLETFEDVQHDPAAGRAVEAFSDERPTRCRLCIGALGVTAVGLARAKKERDSDAIAATLSNATCMCTGCGSLRRALER